MRKIQYVLMVLIVMFVLAACSKKETVTWQEQYDLGMQYLTEGDYEAAIVAFTAAIEIDSKNTDTYLARANAFELSSDNDDYLALAIADYEMALNIDETIVDAYLGLANIYILQEDYESAIAVLEEGLEATENDTNIQDKLNEILSLYDNESAEADTIETTVTGINPFAAFSITDFTSRKNYKNFEEFSVDEQNFIITLVFAAETGDMDVAWELMGTDIFDEGLTSSGTYTIYNSYKLNIARYISTSVTTNGQSESQIENNIVKIEIRPENGFGYYIYMSMNQEADNIYYTTCQCEDWQWNGEYVCERYLRWYAVGIYRLVTMTGEMVDNLRNGIFYSVTKSAYESSNYENYKITAEETSIYNKGWKVDEYTGEVIGSSIYGLNSIYHSPHSRNTYDDLYW